MKPRSKESDLGLTRYKLGDLIEHSTSNNRDEQYGCELIRGVSNKEGLTTPKVDVNNVNLKPYKIVREGAFVYNPSRLNLGSLAYCQEELCIVSHLYTVFYLNDRGRSVLNPIYLFLYFMRDEFFREVTFRNFGSQRPEFNFKKMSDLEINLPPIEIQQKYVDIYNAMVANQRCYEDSLEDLKLACDAQLEKLLKEESKEKIGPYIVRHDERNRDNSIKNVKGVSTAKEFRDPTAKVDVNKLHNYKIVHPKQISFVQTTNNEKVLSSALNLTNEDIVVTSVNEVFSTDETNLLPEYLELFLLREEFDRYARFHSWGSARETFSWTDMQEVEIPIPRLQVQRALADMFTSYSQRKEINKRLKVQIKDICPILIKGSLEEANRS